MSTTRSAKAKFALGATLIVFCAPATASVWGSSVQGIDSNGTTGIDSNGVLGIDSNGTQGIDSNGVLGIDSNGTTGIDSNGVLGIDSNGTQGIDSNGTQGIDSNGTQGIDSNGTQGIDSNGTTGIDSNGVLGIDSNGTQGIDSNGTQGIDSNGTTGIDSNGSQGRGSDLLIEGPVDSIDRMNGVFGSMGQIVMASQDMLIELQVGDYVTVEGTVISSGWYYADAVDVSDQLYVPGSTEVFVSGVISSANPMNGTAQMGDLTIDYTPSLGSSNAPSGTAWSFRGIRPSQGGMMISDRTAGADLR